MVLWLEDLGSVVNGGCKQLVTGGPLNVSNKGVTIGHKNLCIYPFPQFFFWAVVRNPEFLVPRGLRVWSFRVFLGKTIPQRIIDRGRFTLQIFTDVYSL